MKVEPQCEKRLVLVIDDDTDIHDLFGGVLRTENAEIVSAYDGFQALTVARRAQPDLILLDYDMPCMNGIEVLEALRKDNLLAFTPVIFVTGDDRHQLLTECFRAGANDYIRKPICAAELKARANALLDRKQLRDELERLSLHDGLTGLPNREAIHRKIQSAIDHSCADDYAVLYLDLDQFKLVNYSLGHSFGDELLRQVAHRLQELNRGSDELATFVRNVTVARTSGDEFVLLLEGLESPDDARDFAERLMDKLAETYFIAGHQICSTASMGLALGSNAYSQAEEIVRDAGIAMDAAKDDGRGGWVVFKPVMKANAQHRLTIESDLRSAIEKEELLVDYQPIVSLENGLPVAFEALVRMRHYHRGTILPAEFLPIAEETGLIIPMGAWVLDNACRDFAMWQRVLGEAAPGSIHVNISRKQLLLSDLPRMIGYVLEKHNIAAGCLHLEVTEGDINQNIEASNAILSNLRQLGVKIDIDDFGIRHSSLECLQELPLDALKIARSFTKNIERSSDFAGIVQAVIELGQKLGLPTFAEGIETATQAESLQQMGCAFGQGHFFAKAMSAEEVVDYMRNFGNASRKRGCLESTR